MDDLGGKEVSEQLTDAEPRDRVVLKAAEFYVLVDDVFADGCWVIADPDDPRMRTYLTEEEGMTPEVADAVLAKMRELEAGHR
jgi:hypothetical protein